MRTERNYQKPDETRVIELYKAGKTFYSIMLDQNCTIEALYDVLRKAYFDKKNITHTVQPDLVRYQPKRCGSSPHLHYKTRRKFLQWKI